MKAKISDWINGTAKKIVMPISALLLFGCDDYVTVDQPSSQLTSQTVFNDKTTATAALLDVYAKLRESSVLSGRSNGLSALMGLYTDELVFYGEPLHYGANYYRRPVGLLVGQQL